VHRQQQQAPQASLLLQEPLPAAVPAEAEVQPCSSPLSSLSWAKATDAEALDAAAAQASSRSQLLQQLLQDHDDAASSVASDHSDEEEAEAKNFKPQQQQQQQPVLVHPGVWAPALSPVHEEAISEQASPEKSSCSTGISDGDGLHKDVLQLRVALATAQSELESSRRLVELLSAEHPDDAQLVEAGAKQEQARQEVRP
jgi:hypothetical protein